MKIFKMEIFVKRLLLTTGFITLFSCCVISQEQNDFISTENSKGKGYYFGLNLDYSISRIDQLENKGGYYALIYNNTSVLGGVTIALTSLHNLNNNWDIGFKIGISDHGNYSSHDHLTSLLIVAYGYYYPFEKRIFFRFGLENNKHITLSDDDGGGSHGDWLNMHEYRYRFNFRTSPSLALGYNANNTFLLNIGISMPFYNEYGYYNVQELPSAHPFPRGKYPTKMYYTLSAGFTYLFI